MPSKLPNMCGPETRFVRLPKTLQRPIKWGCHCPHCKAHPDQQPHWDTLAFDPSDGYSWTVHYPDFQYKA